MFASQHPRPSGSRPSSRKRHSAGQRLCAVIPLSPFASRTSTGRYSPKSAIQPDSLLGQLGVQEGDTIQSLNGVPIRNLSDVSNAVNSLLGGARMDVTVVREGKPVNLGYAVK